MKKIVITNEKGGTGKSTAACLLVEYLNHLNKRVQLTDIDLLRTSQIWVDNCQAEGRQVSWNRPEYHIIDTAGSSGSALGWIRQADLIVVPLQIHYADLKVSTDWFLTLNSEIQQKIIFLPNRWQNTKEQREGMKQMQDIVLKHKAQLTPTLANRPALYGVLLNGSKENFFDNKKDRQEAENVMRTILKYLENGEERK